MIIQINDLHTTTQYRLEDFGKDIITFGRNTDQDIVIKDINTSRSHGYFQRRQGKWYVCDNNSTNGISVNGNKINEVILFSNNIIVLSVNNQQRAVHIKVLFDEYNLMDRANNFNDSNMHNEDEDEDTVLLSELYNKNINKYTDNNNGNYGYDNYSVNYNKNNFDYYESQERNRRKKIVIISSCSIAAIALLILYIIFVPKFIKKKAPATTEIVYVNTPSDIMVDETTEDTTETIVETVVSEPTFKDFYMVDYAILAKLIAENSYKYNDGVSGCELFDSDNDGIPELYITEPLNEDTVFSGRESIFRINHYKNPQIMSITDTSGQGHTDIFVSEGNEDIYYCICTDIGIISENYSVWDNDSMLEVFSYGYNNGYDEFGNNIISDKYLYYRGVPIDPETWDQIKVDLNLRNLNNNYKNIITVKADDNIENVKMGLEEHINEIGCSFLSKNIDIDNNGSEETVFIINDYAKKWIDNNYEQYSFDGVPFNQGFIPNDNVIIILEQSDDKTIIRVEIIDVDDEIIDVDVQEKLIFFSKDNEYEYTYNPDDDVLLNSDKPYNDNIWKQTYINYINVIAPNMEYIDFALSDMDNDGIPEMIISANLNNEYAGIYVYNNGNVDLIYNYQIQSIEYKDGIYYCLNPRFEWDSPLSVTGIRKEGGNIVWLLDFSFIGSLTEGIAHVNINNAEISDYMEECINILANYGINVEYFYDEELYISDWSFTIPGSVRIEWISALNNNGVIDTSEIENYIWSY